MLPTLVIGGYLGAGKTTLVNHLLRHAGGRRIAVLVNDFGEISIDADLIEGADGEVLSLAGGCICCSFGADLVGALQRLAAREPRPELVLLECSGVGLPAAVARTARLASGVRIEGIVTVVDALALREQLVQPYVGDTVRQQLVEADLLVLGKADRVPASALQDLQRWLHEAGITAPCVPAEQGRVAPELVIGLRLESEFGLGLGAEGAQDRPFAPRSPAWAAHAASRYVAETVRPARALDVAALGAELLSKGVLRAKGLLLDVSGQWLELHVAGRRLDVRAAARPTRTAASARGTTAGELVTITLRVG